jgi:ABC-2 type transport system ATP-binding protein
MPRNMSGGQKRRLDIVMALIHSPKMVFLDEPTTGLDPQARVNLWDHISDLRTKQGNTVFLTTHYLDEADALADRILIIDRGEIVASDTPDNLKAQVSGDLVSLEVTTDEQVSIARDKLASIAETVEVDGHHVSGRVPRAAKVVPGLLRDVESAGVTLEAIEVARPTLDDVFLTVTGRSLRDAEAANEAKPGADESTATITEGASA